MGTAMMLPRARAIPTMAGWDMDVPDDYVEITRKAFASEPENPVLKQIDELAVLKVGGII